MSSIIGIFILLICSLGVTHGQVCTWTLTSPASTTYTRSVGAPAVITATVANEAFADGSRLTWEGNDGTTTTDLSIMRYTAASNSFAEILASPRGTGTSSVGSHSISLSALLESENLAISAVSGGCTSGDRSPVVTLAVTYCDLTFFGSAGTASDTSNCGYNCERTFECQVHSSLTFTATCQEDATWSETEVQCNCGWRGVAPYILLGLAFISVLFLYFYLIIRWAKKSGNKDEGLSVTEVLSSKAAICPGLLLLLLIINLIWVSAAPFCSLIAAVGGTVLGSLVIFFAIVNFLALESILHKNLSIADIPDKTGGNAARNTTGNENTGGVVNDKSEPSEDIPKN